MELVPLISPGPAHFKFCIWTAVIAIRILRTSSKLTQRNDSETCLQQSKHFNGLNNKAHDIFRLAEAVIDSGDVLVCKLVNGKGTYVHRRLCLALVRLASKFDPEQLAEVKSMHTPSGKHELRITPYPRWVPVTVKKAAQSLNESEAIAMIGDWITSQQGICYNKFRNWGQAASAFWSG